MVSIGYMNQLSPVQADSESLRHDSRSTLCSAPRVPPESPRSVRTREKVSASSPLTCSRRKNEGGGTFRDLPRPLPASPNLDFCPRCSWGWFTTRIRSTPRPPSASRRCCRSWVAFLLRWGHWCLSAPPGLRCVRGRVDERAAALTRRLFR